LSEQSSRRRFLRRSAQGAAGLLALGATDLLAGCGRRGASSSGTRLSYKIRQSLIEAANTMVVNQARDWGKANSVEVAADLESMQTIDDLAKTAAETKAGADIVEVSGTLPHLLTDRFLDVTDLAEEIGRAHGGWFPAAEESCRIEGRWRGIPRAFAPGAVVYRTDLFEKVKVETPVETWDEMLEAGRKLKAAGLPPLGFTLGRAVGDGNGFTHSLLWSFGGSTVAEDGKTIAIDSDETARALDFCRRLYQEAMLPTVTSWLDDSNNTAMFAGQVAATLNGSSIWVEAERKAPQFYPHLDHFLLPAGPAGRKTYMDLVTQVIFVHSPLQQKAIELLRYLNSTEQHVPWLQVGMALNAPLLQGYRDDPSMPWHKEPKLKAQERAPEFGHLVGYPGPPNRFATEASQRYVIVDMFQMACRGRSTRDAIAWADRELKKIYATAG
jgi:multiple sugar transport system substrate-binding protein